MDAVNIEREAVQAALTIQRVLDEVRRGRLTGRSARDRATIRRLEGARAALEAIGKPERGSGQERKTPDRGKRR